MVERSTRMPPHRTFTRRRLLAMGAGLAGSILVTACGAPSEVGPRGGAPPTATPAAGIRLRSRVLAPGGPRGALRLGLAAGDEADRMVFARSEQQIVYSNLVGLDPRQPMAYMDLAEAIEFVDPLLLRVSLHPGAHFHLDRDDEVEPLDAETVRRDFARRAAEGVYLFREVVELVETPSDHELLIRLRAPFALLFELLARPDAAIRGDGRYAVFNEPVGSGPFVPIERETWGHGLVANPIWHGGEPGLSQVTVLYMDEHRELDGAFVRGEIDVREHPHPESRAAAEAREDAVGLSRPSKRQRGVGLSLLPQKDGRSVRHVEAFQDERVRRAVSFALGRQTLAEIDGAMLSGPVGPAHAGDALLPVELQAHTLLRHDPAEARSLLAAAGADELSFRLHHPDTPGMMVLARPVAEQLREAGLAPRLAALPVSEWETAFPLGDFEAAVFELAPLDTPDLGLRLHTSGGLTGRFSLWGYSNPVYDAATRNALSEIDPGRRARRSREAQRLLLDEVPAMFPLSAPLEHASVAPTLRGYEFNAYDFNTGYLAASWTVT